MLRYRVIPVLLFKNYGLVKTMRFRDPVYIGDPINVVKIFNEKEVDELVILDITATREKREPNYTKITDIVSEAFMPVGYGGGISRMDQIEKLFKLGVEKVIINTAAVCYPAIINQAANTFGNQSIVVAIDIKQDLFGVKRIFTHSGTVKQRINIVTFLKKVEDSGAGEILINSIDHDGTMQGYDFELVRIVSNTVKIPVIACGGAGKIEDFAEAINMGASAVAAGAMFVFHGVYRAVLINYPEYSELEKLIN